MPTPVLNIADILLDSRVNGPGRRDVIWLQGCSIRCKGCFNSHLWSFEPKFLVPIEGLVEKLARRIGHIEGISILGGEPIHQSPALDPFLDVLQSLGLTVVLYTGFTYEYLIKQKNPAIDHVLRSTDILIDGSFIEEQKDTTLIWRGSLNQRILFLSSAYDEGCIPDEEAYFHSEIHLFNDLSSEINTGGRRTGVW